MEKEQMNLDDIFNECVKEENKRSSERLLGYGIIVTPWEQFEEIKSVSYKEIKNLAESYDWYRKGFSMQVAKHLYLYNSQVNIVKANDKSLLVLPKAGVVIDLFNNEKEDFIDSRYNDDVDYYINEILKVICREGYVFYSLNDALSAKSVLYNHKIFPVSYFRKDTIIAQGTTFFGEKFYKIIMNQIFHGEHNWAPCVSYSDAFSHLKSSLLDYNVICYESLSYIREDSDYCIETKATLDDPNNIVEFNERQAIAIFACYDPNNPQAGVIKGEYALKYLGMFRLDKERSEKENHVAFKLSKLVMEDKLYI